MLNQNHFFEKKSPGPPPLIVAFKRKLKITLKLRVKSYLKNELKSYVKSFDNSNMNTYVFTETRP